VGKKTIEPLGVEVDELTLALVGWQVDEFQARLVTESFGRKDHFQQIAVSATLRFVPGDWSDRFTGSGYVPSPHLVLNRRGATMAPSFEWVMIETEKKASKRPLRISRTSSSWECKAPLNPEDLVLGLTAYDLDDLDTRFELPPAQARDIPLELVDETSLDSVRVRLDSTSAQLLGDDGDDGGKVRVHLEGTFEYGTAHSLFVDYLAAGGWQDARATLADACPFEVDLPGVVVEVVDEGGFLLMQREPDLQGHIPVGEAGKLPGRQPRWAVQVGVDLEDLAGVPARVLVRVLDAGDL
jgi:hypothetical protein